MLSVPVRSKALQYIIALVSAALIPPLLDSILAILPDIGWHFLTVLYILILTGLVLFYYLTSLYPFWWGLINFVLNFVVWVAEQVNLEKQFDTTAFYRGEYSKFSVLLLGGFLWATNKIVIEFLFSHFPSIKTRKNWYKK